MTGAIGTVSFFSTVVSAATITLSGTSGGADGVGAAIEDFFGAEVPTFCFLEALVAAEGAVVFLSTLAIFFAGAAFGFLMSFLAGLAAGFFYSALTAFLSLTAFVALTVFVALTTFASLTVFASLIAFATFLGPFFETATLVALTRFFFFSSFFF